ncbi:MAG: PAAR domain-containing protein [Myxococcales bacterium]|nr:PAAR domain-containing protein [Myxococcales bacterium]
MSERAAVMVGTPTAHLGVVVMGEGTVLIGNMPAARMGDFHTCSFTSPIPHVGGPIVDGHPMVLIANMPAASEFGTAFCQAPPTDILTPVNRSVLIGDGPGSGGGGGGGGGGEGSGDATTGEDETVQITLRLRAGEQGVQNASGQLYVDGVPMDVTTDGDGVLTADIPAKAATGYLILDQDPPEGDAAPPPEAGEASRPAWTNAGGDHVRYGEAAAPANRLEIPIVFGQLEPIDPSLGGDDPTNRDAAKQRLVQLGYLDARDHEALSAAILDFQIYQGLDPTGTLDEATLQALDGDSLPQRSEG